ncbi:MAG: nucleotidyl transferase AbiEii/AbiGii toxin family protein [Lachnospiraceae bacterium]|jgi:predicted nucleotidyltransferase component of viral defense system|nr:nucleotidyl transferase AbiEii/AbiGii toxin family protein [Lachnospiraceae bacterium]
MNLSDMTSDALAKGYEQDDAQARVCQDIVLKAISESSLSRNVTIKGGVVMRSITGNIRRATQDMDIDFIKYSLSDEAIERFIEKLNCLDGIKIKRIGKIEELNQQDYKGKRVYIDISDRLGNHIESKIDLGVHKHLEIEQEEYCFDIGFDNEGASLLINSREQMFTEKLRSLLKFGTFSTRYKDIYDMYYQCGKLNPDKLKICVSIYILDDPGMRENDQEAILKRVKKTFSDEGFKQRVDASDKRWLDNNIDEVLDGILSFLQNTDLI